MCIHAPAYVYRYIDMYVSICIYICMYMCVLIHFLIDIHSTFLVFLSRKIGLNYLALPLIEVEVLSMSFAGLLQYTLNLSL